MGRRELDPEGRYGPRPLARVGYDLRRRCLGRDRHRWRHPSLRRCHRLAGTECGDGTHPGPVCSRGALATELGAGRRAMDVAPGHGAGASLGPCARVRHGAGPSGSLRWLRCAARRPGVADSVLADTWEATLEEISVDGPHPDPAAAASYPALASSTLWPETVTGQGFTGLWVTFDQPVNLQVVLDGPAPLGGVRVDIFQGKVKGDPVLVAAGETIGSHPFTSSGPSASSAYTWAAALKFGENEIQARLGDVTKTAVLHIVH